MSKFCMSCGVGNPDNATVCLRCGKPLEQTTEGSANSTMLNNMGYQQNQQTKQGQEQLSQVVKKTTESKRNLIILACVVGVIVVIAAFMLIGGGNKLVGKWGHYTFSKDMTYTYQSGDGDIYTGTYEISGKNLTLYNNEGKNPEEYEFSVTDSSLTLIESDSGYTTTLLKEE